MKAAAITQTVEYNGRTVPRYMVGVSRGYCVYDRASKTFGERLPNKRAAVAEVKRLNRTPVEEHDLGAYPHAALSSRDCSVCMTLLGR